MNHLATLPPQSSIILDACCAITLVTSGEAGDILSATGRSICMATYVLKREIVRPDQVAVISELVTSGMIIPVSPANEAEEKLYVWLASLNLDNGECVTGALASQRDWAVAIDDHKAHNIFASELPRVVRLTTPDLLFNWAEVTRPLPLRISVAVKRIQLQGRYMPSRTHPLHDWWQSYTESNATRGS